MGTGCWLVACALVGGALAAGVVPARGVAATGSERSDARHWIATRLLRPGDAPFSFLYGGVSSRAATAGWKRTLETRTLSRTARALTVTWADPATGLRVRLEAIAYRDVPAVQWVLRLANAGSSDTPIVEGLQALDDLLPARAVDPVILHHSLGDRNSAESFRPLEDALQPGAERAFAPVGGRSSDGCMPFFNLHTGTRGVALAIGWTGQWAARFGREPGGSVRVQAGMERTHFRLHPGEEIRTPRILLVFWRGVDAQRGNRLLRRTLIEHVTPRRDGQVVMTPICGSVAEVAPDGSYEEPHLRVMRPLAAVGVEVFWSDMDPQQWYPGGFPGGTGTWEPDPQKYPHGLKPIGDAARAAGLGYLLWFEPERAAPGTQIAREHPEWVHGGAAGGLFRLDDPLARRWLTEKIDTQIALARVTWVRWDFNIQPLAYWRRNDAPDRQGLTEIRHVEGLYAMWDELERRHPGLLIDICASGGRRLDIEALSRGLPLWHSDLQCEGAHPEADQLQNAGLYRWLPLHGCGVFGLEPSYVFRSAMTTGNVFALAAYAPENAAGVRRSVAIQKKLRPYFLGDFHALLPHLADADRWFAYQFHREDLDAGFLAVFRRAHCGEESVVLPVHGVHPRARYEVEFAGTEERKVMTGAALGALRVAVPEAPGATIVVYRAVGSR